MELLWLLIPLLYAAVMMVRIKPEIRRYVGIERCHGTHAWMHKSDCLKYDEPGCWRPGLNYRSRTAVSTALGHAFIWPFRLAGTALEGMAESADRDLREPEPDDPVVTELEAEIGELEAAMGMRQTTAGSTLWAQLYEGPPTWATALGLRRRVVMDWQEGDYINTTSLRWVADRLIPTPCVGLWSAETGGEMLGWAEVDSSPVRPGHTLEIVPGALRSRWFPHE